MPLLHHSQMGKADHALMVDDAAGPWAHGHMHHHHSHSHHHHSNSRHAHAAPHSRGGSAAAGMPQLTHASSGGQLSDSPAAMAAAAAAQFASTNLSSAGGGGGVPAQTGPLHQGAQRGSYDLVPAFCSPGPGELRKARALQQYLCSYEAHGVPVVDVQYGGCMRNNVVPGHDFPAVP